MKFSIRLSAYYPDHNTKRGFHIQTTPLSDTHDHILQQVDAFKRGKDELGEKGEDVTLSLSHVAVLAKSQQDKRKKIELAHHYYGLFDNVFTGDGMVEEGLIAPIPAKYPLNKRPKICTFVRRMKWLNS